jgi:23S rRNA-/tRNA-specific pseudouridylate synthase
MTTIVSSHGFEYGVKHFYSPDDGMAIDIVQNALNLDHSVIINLFKIGAIYINNQRTTNPHQSLNAGQQIRVHTKPRRYYVNYDWSSRIVFEHEDFVILNKPAGLPSHPSVDNVIENSLTQLETVLKHKLLISHRLDTTTEGLIVYGKKAEFVKAFNIQLQSKNIEKKYVALIQKKSDKLPTHLIHYMERSPRAPKKVTTIFTAGWDECELMIEDHKKYELYGYYARVSSLDMCNQ